MLAGCVICMAPAKCPLKCGSRVVDARFINPIEQDTEALKCFFFDLGRQAQLLCIAVELQIARWAQQVADASFFDPCLVGIKAPANQGGCRLSRPHDAFGRAVAPVLIKPGGDLRERAPVQVKFR